MYVEEDGTYVLEDGEYYKGVPHLKIANIKVPYTAHHIEEIEKCRKDPIYFIENYCRIVTNDYGMVLFKMHDYQKALALAIINNRMVISMQPRQSGKSTVIAAVFIWFILFHADFNIALLANKLETAITTMERAQRMYEELPVWMQMGVLRWNQKSMLLENKSRIFVGATSSQGIRGKTANILAVDEVAVIAANIAESFFTAILPVVSSGSTTKIVQTSTPIGYNHFWKTWMDACVEEFNPTTNKMEKVPNTGKPGKNGYVAVRAFWDDNPERDLEWYKQEEMSLGPNKFRQEVLCEFLGSSLTLFSGASLQRQKADPPIFLSPDGTFRVYKAPSEDRSYVMTVDVSQGVKGDYTAVMFIDVTEDTKYEVVAVFHSNEIAPMLLPMILKDFATRYNNAWVLVEANDAGMAVVDQLAIDMEYPYVFSTVTDGRKVVLSPGFDGSSRFGVRMQPQVKRLGCFGIKSLVEDQRMIIPDAQTIYEMSIFVEKNNSYAHEDGEGNHDDLMMSLVLFGWLIQDNYFKEMTSHEIRKHIQQQLMAGMAEDSVGFFGVSDSEASETFVEDGLLWTTVDNYSTSIPWAHEVEFGIPYPENDFDRPFGY